MLKPRVPIPCNWRFRCSLDEANAFTQDSWPSFVARAWGAAWAALMTVGTLAAACCKCGPGRPPRHRRRPLGRPLSLHLQRVGRLRRTTSACYLPCGSASLRPPLRCCGLALHLLGPALGRGGGDGPGVGRGARRGGHRRRELCANESAEAWAWNPRGVDAPSCVQVRPESVMRTLTLQTPLAHHTGDESQKREMAWGPPLHRTTACLPALIAR